MTNETTEAQPPEHPEAESDAAEAVESAAPQAGHSDASALVESAPTGAEEEPADEDEPAEDRIKVLEREGDIAADYLEELLDIADLDGDLDMDVEGDRASVSIVGGDLGQLIGRNGEVLDALQELTRLAVLRETGERSRLMLDIGGHRAKRREVLEGVARDAIEQVNASGESVALNPMSPFERKVVHDVVASAGLASDSEGAEPKRYVVVRPA